MALKLTVMTLDIDPESKPTVQVFDKDELTIGRLPSNDLVLNRPEISGIHARLRIEKSYNNDEPKLFITDLGSSNGTMVEKNPLRSRVEVAMMPNERVFIGNFVIKPSFDFETSSVFVNKEKNENTTTEIRRSYLSEALKEYEEGRKEVNLEQRIDQFAEERAVANSNLNNSYSEKAIEKEPSSRTSGTTSFLSMGAMFGREQKNEEPISPFGRGFFKQIEQEEEKVLPQEDTIVSMKEFDTSYVSKVSEPVVKFEEPEAKQELFVEPKRTRSSSNDMLTSPSTINNVVDVLSIKVKVDGGDVNSFNFLAAAYTELKGKIMHKGSPLAGVKVEAGVLGDVVTSADGVFKFSKVLEGSSYSLKLSKDKFVFEPKEVTGTTSLSASEINVSATQLFAISGVISHQGKPLSGVEVDGGELGKTTTKEDGSYRFENVPEGKEYSLSLSKPGYAFQK